MQIFSMAALTTLYITTTCLSSLIGVLKRLNSKQECPKNMFGCLRLRAWQCVLAFVEEFFENLIFRNTGNIWTCSGYKSRKNCLYFQKGAHRVKVLKFSKWAQTITTIFTYDMYIKALLILSRIFAFLLLFFTFLF